ncbi:MAG: GspE/PulE family protein [Trinickia sp.]
MALFSNNANNRNNLNNRNEPARTAGAGSASSTNSTLPRGDAVDVANATALSSFGPLAASEQERKFLCLLDDGRLLVAEGHEMNPFVLSYCARLNRINHLHTQKLVSLEAVRAAYRSARGEGGVSELIEHTEMQVAAKELIARACRERASDIHIRVQKFNSVTYFRIHNELVRMGEQPRYFGERLLATFYSAMASVADNTYKPTERQDASIADRDKLPEQLFGVRIATAPTSEGNVMVLRLLYNDAGDATDLTDLGFTAAQAADMAVLRQHPEGMNIISGPTGSGKSTTLQRVLTELIRETAGGAHVITVEDPVEYPIPGAVQTPVVNASGEEARSAAFSAAIANSMRLDPDTIMIGEIRDRASAQIALRASMTGHQVWTTVHANSAIAIVDRLVDLGLPLSMVADETIVSGLISQRLVKVLCSHCKQRFVDVAHELDAALMERVRRAVGGRLQAVCVTGEGCEHCRGRGTLGRTVVAEVIRTDAQFFSLLRTQGKAAAADYWRRALDGQTVMDHTIQKVASGLVDPRMAERVVGRLLPSADIIRAMPVVAGTGYGT